jgi:hypothetical protein
MWARRGTVPSGPGNRPRRFAPSARARAHVRVHKCARRARARECACTHGDEFEADVDALELPARDAALLGRADDHVLHVGQTKQADGVFDDEVQCVRRRAGRLPQQRAEAQVLSNREVRVHLPTRSRRPLHPGRVGRGGDGGAESRIGLTVSACGTKPTCLLMDWIDWGRPLSSSVPVVVP